MVPAHHTFAAAKIGESYESLRDTLEKSWDEINNLIKVGSLDDHERNLLEMDLCRHWEVPYI